MSTALYKSIIFGPVKSRRLGTSLGVNLLPVDCKVCNFNCIYCECGWTDYKGKDTLTLPDRADVYEALEKRLHDMYNEGDTLDVITFAGNGEPTLNPDFPDIIDDTKYLRNMYFPTANVAVLSNATTIGNKRIREALLKVDKPILKLDSALSDTIDKHNKPAKKMDVAQLVENMKKFEGKAIIQTLFVRGIVDGVKIDNTTDEEVGLWLDVIKEVSPKEVEIYTIARDTPAEGLEKVSVPELTAIAEKVQALGISTKIAG